MGTELFLARDLLLLKFYQLWCHQALNVVVGASYSLHLAKCLGGERGHLLLLEKYLDGEFFNRLRVQDLVQELSHAEEDIAKDYLRAKSRP